MKDCEEEEESYFLVFGANARALLDCFLAVVVSGRLVLDLAMVVGVTVKEYIPIDGLRNRKYFVEET